MVPALVLTYKFLYILLRFPRPSYCSYSRRDDIIDGGRPGGEGERGERLNEPNKTRGGG
jgi:hypothetical protein